MSGKQKFRWIAFFCLMALVILPSGALAGERVTNGGFGSSTSWTNWTQRGSFTRNFNSTSNIPSGGSSPCLTMSSSNGNGGVYQTLSLVSGQTYTVSGYWRDYNSSSNCCWAEVHIGTSAPVNGSDYGSSGTQKFKSDTWSCDNWNGSFTNTHCVGTKYTTFVASASTMYITLKCGQGCGSVNVSWDTVSVTGPDPGVPTSTPTKTFTRTPTRTPTNTYTNTFTNTPTHTFTYTRTNTPTNTFTNTPTHTYTYTRTNTPVNTATNTPAGCTNAVTNGGFGSSTSWSNWAERGTITRNFNSTSNVPSGGTSPCLTMSSSDCNGGVYQALSLVNGQTYSVAGYWRDYASPASAAWAEVHVTSSAPVNGSDLTAGLVFKCDTWACNDWNGGMLSTDCNGSTSGNTFTASASTMYITLKQGGNCAIAWDSIEVCGAAPGNTPTNTNTSVPTNTNTPAPVSGFLANPGFENGFDANNMGNSWTSVRSSGYTTAEYMVGTDYKYAGSYSQKFKMTTPSVGTSDKHLGVYQRFQVVPGQSYTASMKYRMTLSGEAYTGSDLICRVGIDKYGDTNYSSGGVVWSSDGANKNSWQDLSVTAQSETGYITVYYVMIRKWAQLGVGYGWIDSCEVTGPAIPTSTPTNTGTPPTDTPTETPTNTPPSTYGPNKVTNGNFESTFSSGVASGWSSWQTAGTTGFWEKSTLAGPIGTGNYAAVTGWYEETVDMVPKAVLLGCGFGAAESLGAETGLEDTIVIGRFYADAYAESWYYNTSLTDAQIIANGRAWADGTIQTGLLGPLQESVYHPRVDAWCGVNEPDWGDAEKWRRMCVFEQAAAERMHELGLKSLVMNLAVGNPGDINRMKLQCVRDLFDVADYVGYHCYGGPADELMITPYLEETNQNDPLSYALRWRNYADIYEENGWRMPPVIYTEGTTYGGWHGTSISSSDIRDDLIDFIPFINEDRWAIGMNIFCAGGSGIWTDWDISETGMGDDIGVENTAAPVDCIDGVASQQFGRGNVRPLTSYTHSGQFTGGVVQQITGLTSGKYYRLKYSEKYDFRGLQPQLSLYHGIDNTGQTSNGSAGTINWSSDFIAAGSPTETHEVFYDREHVFQASSSSISLWFKAYQPSRATSFQVTLDGVSLWQLDPNWTP